MNGERISLQENLQQLMNTKDLTESGLARATGIPQATINRLTSGTTDDPRFSTLKPLADYFDITVSHLTGELPLPVEFLQHDTSESNKLVRSPILTWQQAKDWETHLQDKEILQDNYWVTVDAENNDKLYTLCIDKKHLPAPFYQGTKIIINPEKQYIDGDKIIVHRHRDDAVLLRQIQIDGTDTWLLPLQSALPAEKFNDEFNYCGTIILIHMNLLGNE